jgi:methyl-accepting chemotaxis protein
MKKLKLKTKLLLGFGLVIALSVVLGGLALFSLESTSSSYVNKLEYSSERIQQVYDIKFQVMNIRRITTAINAYCGDVRRQEGYKIESAEACANVYSDVDEHIQSVTNDVAMSEEQKAVFIAEAENLRTSLARYKRDLIDVNIEFGIRNDKDSLLANSRAQAPLIAAVQASIVELFRLEEELAIALLEKTYAQTNRYRLLFYTITAAIALISVVLAMGISGGIVRGLKYVIGQLSITSKMIKESSVNVNEASDALVSDSSKQAATIEETSATMHQISSMIENNAENTKEASKIAMMTTDSVNEAGRCMSELMEMMTELNESSTRVSRIMKTMDEIAFQTNLLALNAAVEAARAGEVGAGFAVVADEVRNLASRSASASSETAEIIGKNMELTNTSRSAAEQMMSISKKNAQQITDLDKLISEISAASEEQASGLKQIYIAINQMEKATQDTVVVAEGNATLAQKLGNEFINLNQSIDELAYMV